MAGAFSLRFVTGSLIGMMMITASAYAHHGWSWADADQIELSGTIGEISMAPPHPTLNVETKTDGIWLVELGNPRQTERSGLRSRIGKSGRSGRCPRKSLARSRREKTESRPDHRFRQGL
jgi:hypothetical protein